MQLTNHQEMVEEALEAIFNALEMDAHARKDAWAGIIEWLSFHKALELNIWTGNASKQQVLWHLLAYSYVPGLARRLAFWSLAGTQHGQPFDAGMPGGEFWFLPAWDEKNGKLTLPMAQVMNWLLDLLNTDSFNIGLVPKNLGAEDHDTVVRTLYNWRKGGTPQSAEKFEQHFPDDAALNFSGAFQLNENSSIEEQLQSALDFVRRKGLDATALADQIPMTVERLDRIFNQQGEHEEEQEFIRLIALRYAQPSMRTIRQRLRIARMTQDGYQRLLKNLCGDDVETTCADPAQNKLLQLLALFQTIYNTTIQASQNADSFEEQDAWFEARFPPWDQMDLLLSIMPSQKETACLELAKQLTRKFMPLEHNSPLENLVSFDMETAESIIKHRLLFLQKANEEDLHLQDLIERARRGAAPGRALRSETSYWVITQFVPRKDLPAKILDIARQRMRELAITPGQTVQAIMADIEFLLNGEPKQRPQDIKLRVDSLMAEAESNVGYEQWKAPLLSFRAKHNLMQNNFEQANRDYKSALNACSERNFGGLQGRIARDGFATEIAFSGSNPNNQEHYYRNMLRYGMFSESVPSFEDAAVWCEDFFWSELYHPYRDFEKKQARAAQDFEVGIKETFSLIRNENWEGLQHWLESHAKAFRNMQFKDVRGDSILLRWLKMNHHQKNMLPTLNPAMPLEMLVGFHKFEKHIANQQHAIELLIAAWPEQGKISDFKGQTPLMLVADKGDEKLTRLLAPISDVDVQDHIGRTVLHSAVSGRSPHCVAIILALNPDVCLATKDEKNTALHTAVRFGQPDCVRLILEEFPGLSLQPNTYGQTPLHMAQDLSMHLESWKEFILQENRQTGSKADFEAIITLLEFEAP